MNTLMPMTIGLALFALAVTSYAWNAAEDGQPISRFERTAVLAGEGDAQTREAFAVAALTHLALAYEEEAALALSDAAAPQADRALVGWASAVRRYARQFALLIEDATSGFPVSIFVGAGSLITISVAERTVILNHPRPQQQAVFEQAVIADFCSGNPCPTGADEPGRTTDKQAYAGPVRPHWSFDADGSLCSLDGLRVRFGPGSKMGAARALCLQFMQEAALLSAEIAWQVRHGVAVSWESLRTYPVPGKDIDRLQLNGLGDAVLADVPLISQNYELLQAMAPWVRDQISGSRSKVVEIPARLLGWE